MLERILQNTDSATTTKGLDLLIKHALEKTPYAELAEEAGINSTTARTRTYRTKKSLREALERRGINTYNEAVRALNGGEL